MPLAREGFASGTYPQPLSFPLEPRAWVTLVVAIPPASSSRRPTDRRARVVVAELDVVLRELLADVPFITETTLRNKYRQLCGKTPGSELEPVGMTLFDLIEMKFADAFIAVRDSRLPGLLRIKFVNQRALLAAHVCRKDAAVQVEMDKAEPVAVNMDSHDSVDSDLAGAAVAAADASDDGPPERNSEDPALSNFDAAKLLDAANIQGENLEEMCREVLLHCQ
ncbi:hypothetical protein AAVH_28515, partial [Aphelenchoides avenae]